MVCSDTSERAALAVLVTSVGLAKGSLVPYEEVSEPVSLEEANKCRHCIHSVSGSTSSPHALQEWGRVCRSAYLNRSNDVNEVSAMVEFAFAIVWSLLLQRGSPSW